MANEELQAMKEDIAEIKQTVKETNKALNDLALVVAGDYVKRKEFADLQKANEAEHRKINDRLTDLVWGFAIAVIGTVIYMIVRR
ncbi:hypothetical protein Tsac_2842 [Thermoanaerobacterium phage THSA-485A]|uniref:hypothetical protein n=1 Tax=Thermoanaerobacterium phage THSA-485A TaxID=1126885 RepID=UPI000263F833|nr:hypothetical protein Tsac_2842 [Thermoanaerobacterium phage THSA-485A]AFK87695.1 hypothetical protein Tsac_2842 [Thermoanaerobacterium phage THSA-485A]